MLFDVYALISLVVLDLSLSLQFSLAVNRPLLLCLNFSSVELSSGSSSLGLIMFRNLVLPSVQPESSMLKEYRISYEFFQCYSRKEFERRTGVIKQIIPSFVETAITNITDVQTRLYKNQKCSFCEFPIRWPPLWHVLRYEIWSKNYGGTERKKSTEYCPFIYRVRKIQLGFFSKWIH